MLAGASAVAMASPVMLRGYGVLADALSELETFLQRKGVTATEIIGLAADRRKTFAEMPMIANNWRRYVPA